MIGDWTVRFDLETPRGTLKLNYTDPATGRRFQLTPRKCSASLPVRSTEDDVPQGDGRIPHRRWRGGYLAHLAVEPLQSFDDETGDGEPACDAALVDMLDTLGLHINAMIRTGLIPGGPNARLIFAPTDHDDRMLDRCQLLAVAAPSLDGELGGTQVEFDIDSCFPYYTDKAETQTPLYGFGSETVYNGGTVDSYPTVEIFGPSSTFTLTNLSVLDSDGNPLQLVYDDSLPGAVAIGAGDFVEFNFFANTAYLNGSGAGRKAGINMLVSDFFPLAPGANVLTLTGATGLVKSNGAFA